MERVNKNKIVLTTLILSIILFIVFIIAVVVGKYAISIDVFLDVVFNPNTTHQVERSVILNLRLPRTIMGLLVGMALSISGLIYQDIFQNKLVSPDFLGVSSGASVGACLAILLGLGGVWICGFSFAFGIVAMLLTLLVSRIFRNTSPTILLLSGIVISGLMDSAIGLIKYMADSDNQLGEITYWLLGTFSRVTMNEVYIMLPIVALSIAILFLIRWRINIISLGKEEAVSRGINYNFYIIVIIFFVTLLTACSVSFCGIIGWVGLVIPHIVRLIIGRNSKKTIPLTIFVGAIFMILCDIISRSFTFSEIPLSVVTGFVGTPVFVYTLFLRRNKIDE